MDHGDAADEVESLAAARKAALSGSEPSDSIRVLSSRNPLLKWFSDLSPLLQLYMFIYLFFIKKILNKMQTNPNLTQLDLNIGISGCECTANSDRQTEIITKCDNFDYI